MKSGKYVILGMDPQMVAKFQSKEDFLEFLEGLAGNLNTNSDAWENKDLPSFLDAMIRWTEDMDGYYVNTNQPIPENVNWKVFADILAAARIYE